MNKFERPPTTKTGKKTAPDNSKNLPPPPEINGEFSDPERQYEHLQGELTRKYLDVEAQFESAMGILNKKGAELQKRHLQLQQLNSLLDDPKEGTGYQYEKQQINQTIARLEERLAAIPPRKTGIIGFRKKVENLAKTVPLKQRLKQTKERLVELDRRAEEEAETNKKRLSAQVTELKVEEPITREKINTLLLAIETEIDELTKQLEKTERDFVLQLDDWPIIGVTSDGQRPQLKQVEEIKEKIPDRAFEMMAYGGNAYQFRAEIGDWPVSIPVGTLSDTYGASNKIIGFGVGEKEGRRFIILRQLQNIQNRGGYAYTILLDFGEEVRRKADYNDAVIIRNILADPVLKHYLLNKPEVVGGIRRTKLFTRLEQSYLRTSTSEDTALQPFMEDIGTEKDPMVFGASSMAEPTPERLAQAIAALSEEERKKFTFLIRGASIHGQFLGIRRVWDPRK